MQLRAPKILLISLSFLFGALSFCQAQVILTTADSLFKARQYTQSFELYQNIYQSGRYSPAMLLKMAYIQEGLGHISKSIYYLQLYYQATNNEPTLKKIEQLADKHKLEGYASTDKTVFQNVLKKYASYISSALFAIGLLLVVLMIYQKRKEKSKPAWSGFAMLVILVLLFVQVNYSNDDHKGIVSARATYLMSGPSAGASVIAIIDEGHQLNVTGQKDIWLRVQWMDKVAFVKEDKLLFAAI